MTPQSPAHPKPLPELMATTNWVLLRTQKAEILKALEVPSLDHELLDGMVSFLDAVQDAADLQGYPVFPDATESQRAEAQEKLAKTLRLQHAFWDALSELEQILDIEIESTSDLAQTTVDDLLLQDASKYCPTCGVPYQDGGDGFDGECPSCADKSEPAEKDEQ